MSLHENVHPRTRPGLLTRSIATAGSIALLAGLLMAPAAQALPMETGTVTEPAPAPVEPVPVDPAPADPAPAGEPSAEATPTETAPADAAPVETAPAEVLPAEVVPTEVTPAAPENISLPVIEGDPVVDGNLTSTGGQWSGAGWIQYTWIIDGVPVQTAGHVVGEADVLKIIPAMAGKSVQLTVTASSDAQAAGTEASAVAVSVRPAAFTVAWSNAVTGRPAVGQELRLNPLTTQGTVTYQWFRGAVAITSATAPRYTVTPGDVGQKLWAKVTLSAPGYLSKQLSSVQVVGVTATFVAAPVPTIGGTARVGQVQTANAGAWAPGGAALSYQWYRGTTAIAGAVGYRYTATAADYGKALKVRVRATKAGFVTLDRYSTARTIGAGTIVATKSLLVTGVHRYGQTLRISQGWTPGVTLKYQWYRNGVAIRGGTASSLYLNPGFIGSRVNVKVTVSKAGYASRAASTKLVTVGKAVITPRTAPKVTGGQWLGATLTANPGTYSPAPSAYGYQWYRNGVAISGARYKTYRIAAADNGKSLSVRVWASKTHYDTRAAGSPAVKLPTWAVTVLRGDGTYRVGTQIKPGLYKSTGGSFCYWARLRGFSGNVSDINANDIVSGVTYVQILPGDVGFESDGCGAWTTVPSTGARATSITRDGTYRVGIDILPGTYYGFASGDFCYWETLSGFTGTFNEIYDNDIPSGWIVVTIPSWARGFSVHGCGTLTRG
ncbi:hypothetical protein QFZ23_003690 [Arthrobacter globiformis]|uniref:hypothetical protein n=1 Tax=Arthrobacter globiformis TaxID=1665 RepID=UPI002782B4F1|nr:hypothetical protein [Arthrobacter globiformis]MDQ1059789.1 hypothetical protein [Arthrobacter globiformis]